MALAFVAIASVGLLFTLWHSAQQTLDHQNQKLIQACTEIQADIQQLFPNEEKAQTRIGNPELLHQQISRITADYIGVEGGFWHIHGGFFGYVFPTYLGSDIKTDISEAESTLISSLSQRAVEQNEVVESVRGNTDSAVISVACPINTHEGLSAWLMQRVSLIPVLNTVTTASLFVVLGVIGLLMLLQTIKFEQRWYGERDRIVKQGGDESKPVPVTSNINEIQPLLMLLYQARQKNMTLERTITALEAKLGRHQDLSSVARFSSAFGKELATRIQQLKNVMQKLASEKQETAASELMLLMQEFERIENLITAFENLDLQQSDKRGVEWVNLQTWLDKIANYHQHRTAKDSQTITAVCTENLTLRSHLLLLRYALDTLVAQAVTFGPEHGEVLLKGSTTDDSIIIEVIDEYEGLSSQEERRLFRRDDVLPESYGDGLKLVHDAIEAMGATLSYRADGENSRFIVQIPMTSE